MSSSLPEPYDTGLRLLQGSRHIGTFLAALLATLWIILSQATNIDRLFAWMRPRKKKKEVVGQQAMIADDSQTRKTKPDLAHGKDEKESYAEPHSQLDQYRKGLFRSL